MIRIAGVQGFYGDSPMGAIAIAKEGAADFLVHDALAELTLSILQKDRQEDPSLGYARDIEFLATSLYPLAIQKGIKIVTNSGGLNPVSAAKKVAEIFNKKGIKGIKIAAITGDDLLGKIEVMLQSGETLSHLETGAILPPLHSESGSVRQRTDSPGRGGEVTHANVYVGASAIADALNQGAQIIFAGRVADPCLTLGILVHHFKWKINKDLTPNPSPLERGTADSVKLQDKIFLSDSEKWKFLKEFARTNRKNPTDEEEILWQQIRNRKLKHKFRRQHSIEDFIVDFICIEKKTIIEVDGEIHEYQKEYDYFRDLVLNSKGFKVLRFSNDEINHNFDIVIKKITSSLKQPTSPSPTERGLGGEVNLTSSLEQPASPSPTERQKSGGLLSDQVRFPEGEVNWDKLAAGITIGHILECGGQASGGNSYAEWPMDYKLSNLGYPIAHVNEDGSAVITKLESAGGKVSRNTIREQLVYEIHDPANYFTPDVIVDLTQIKLEEISQGNVLLTGAKGKPRPEKLKLAIGRMEGFLSEQFFFFSYPYAYEKAKKFIEAVKEIWSKLPMKIERMEFSFIGMNGIHDDAAPMPPPEAVENLNEIGVRLAIKHPDEKTGKIAFQAVVALGLNGPPGLISMPGWGKQNRMLLSLWPTLIDRKWVEMKVEIFET